MRRRRFRIWHISEHPHFFGGIEQNVHALASALRMRGHVHTLVHCAEKTADVDYCAPFRLVHALSDFTQLEGLAAETLPQVIVVHRPFGVGMLEKLCGMAPVIRMVHDHDLVCPRHHKYFPLTKKICREPAGLACVLHGCIIGRDRSGHLVLNDVAERLKDIDAHKCAARIVANSSYIKNELLANGLPAEKIDVLAPLPGDIEFERREYPQGSGEILYVGQLVRGKGVDLLLEALRRVKSQWRLKIVGDGNMRGELEKLVDKYSFNSRVDFLGSVPHDDLEELYGNAALVAVPSRWAEPFGMVGIEAMAAARPVAGFAIGGINDWLLHGINGLAAPAGNLSVLASHIDWLLSDAKLARQLGESGREIFDKKYRFLNYLCAFEKILKTTVPDEGETL